MFFVRGFWEATHFFISIPYKKEIQRLRGQTLHSRYKYNTLYLGLLEEGLTPKELVACTQVRLPFQAQSKHNKNLLANYEYCVKQNLNTKMAFL